jgi:hypothetical protein
MSWSFRHMVAECGGGSIDGAGSLHGGVFYPHFARLEPRRSLPAVERLLDNRDMRDMLVQHDDSFLAFAIDAVGKDAQKLGFAFNGFRGWSQPIEAFISEHLPVGPVNDRFE